MRFLLIFSFRYRFVEVYTCKSNTKKMSSKIEDTLSGWNTLSRRNWNRRNRTADRQRNFPLNLCMQYKQKGVFAGARFKWNHNRIEFSHIHWLLVLCIRNCILIKVMIENGAGPVGGYLSYMGRVKNFICEIYPVNRHSHTCVWLTSTHQDRENARRK